jgi:uncharacterized membrane protein HdeD (DUF308 family)
VRGVILLVYVVMAVWLVLAAAGRLVLQQLNDQPGDPLPLITGALGIVALLLMVPHLVLRRRRGVGRYPHED